MSGSRRRTGARFAVDSQRMAASRMMGRVSLAREEPLSGALTPSGSRRWRLPSIAWATADTWTTLSRAAIYYADGGGGYMIASSQGAMTTGYCAWRDARYLGASDGASDALDGTSNTDASSDERAACRRFLTGVRGAGRAQLRPDPSRNQARFVG